MGCSLPTILEHDFDDLMDNAVPASACGVGWRRAVHEPGCSGGHRVDPGNYIGRFRLHLRDAADLVPMARASGFYDENWIMGLDVFGLYYGSVLFGANGLE